MTSPAVKGLLDILNKKALSANELSTLAFLHAKDKRIRKCDLTSVRAETFGGSSDLQASDTLELLVRELVSLKMTSRLNAHRNPGGSQEPVGKPCGVDKLEAAILMKPEGFPVSRNNMKANSHVLEIPALVGQIEIYLLAIPLRETLPSELLMIHQEVTHLMVLCFRRLQLMRTSATRPTCLVKLLSFQRKRTLPP